MTSYHTHTHTHTHTFIHFRTNMLPMYAYQDAENKTLGPSFSKSHTCTHSVTGMGVGGIIKYTIRLDHRFLR